MKYKGILASSSDPTDETLSTTVRGLIIGSSGLIVLVGSHFFHLNISATDVSSLATELGMMAGSIVAVYGLLMKMVNKVGTTS